MSGRKYLTGMVFLSILFFGTVLFAGEWCYYIQDHLGNTRVVLDNTGKVKEYYDYEPYGKSLRENIAGEDKAIYKFTGKELDEEGSLNWYYFGARYYDAELGRWLSVDPAAEKYPGVSPYVYCKNNPINAFDPDGRQTFPVLNPQSWFMFMIKREPIVQGIEFAGEHPQEAVGIMAKSGADLTKSISTVTAVGALVSCWDPGIAFPLASTSLISTTVSLPLRGIAWSTGYSTKSEFSESIVNFGIQYTTHLAVESLGETLVKEGLPKIKQAGPLAKKVGLARTRGGVSEKIEKSVRIAKVFVESIIGIITEKELEEKVKKNRQE